MASKPNEVAAYDDAEKGTGDAVLSPKAALTRPSAVVPLKDEKDPAAFASPPKKLDAAAAPPAKPAARPKRKVPRWVLWQLWFNTYRKFFTFTFTLNCIGIVLAETGHFPYAINHLGSLLLGNLLFAILMRNEIFGRILYWIVNTFFAKVRFAFLHDPETC